LALPPQKWVPIKQVASDLDLTRGRNDYRAMLQTSIRKLTAHDADLLQSCLRRASASA
jgi:hypothetical protein